MSSLTTSAGRFAGLLLLVFIPTFSSGQAPVGLAANADSPEFLNAPTKSQSLAYVLATAGTLLPYALMPSQVESWSEAWLTAIMVTVGPSLGHFYAADFKRGFGLAAVRFGSLTLGVSTAILGGGGAAALIGFTGFIVGTVWSLASTGRSVRDYNERQSKLSVEPFLDVSGSGGGLTFTLSL